MKNFQQILNSNDNHNKNILINNNKHAIGQLKQQTYFDKARSISFKIIMPITLSLITAPFMTASTLLQMTNPLLINTIESKLKHLQPNDPNYKHIKNGIFGDNKPYKVFQFKSYKDVLKQMGKQGLKGVYKGNLTGMVYTAINAKLRTFLYSQAVDITMNDKQKDKLEKDFVKQNIITITTCTLADLITLPLMFCQSRLILQNSLSNFRCTYISFISYNNIEYKSALSILRRVSLSNLFTGTSLLLLKNTIFSLSWLQLINDSPVYSFILSSCLSHVLTYPFITVIRQMQTNDKQTPMMNNRQENVRQVVKRIWKTNNVKGFYRGFIGYGVVHFFMAIIMLEQNMRMGYFQQVQ